MLCPERQWRCGRSGTTGPVGMGCDEERMQIDRRRHDSPDAPDITLVRIRTITRFRPAGVSVVTPRHLYAERYRNRCAHPRGGMRTIEVAPASPVRLAGFRRPDALGPNGSDYVMLTDNSDIQSRH